MSRLTFLFCSRAGKVNFLLAELYLRNFFILDFTTNLQACQAAWFLDQTIWHARKLVVLKNDPMNKNQLLWVAGPNPLKNNQPRKKPYKT